jgi:predicted MFS family arabinose efflux permease
MAGFMALWAAVSALTALAKDFKGLLLTRFFLGITGMVTLCMDL